MRNPLELYKSTRLLSTNTRALEAQVFRRVLYQLHTAESSVELSRALADLRLVWLTVLGLVTDADNHLPAEIQHNLAQQAKAVLAHLDLAPEHQDINLLIQISTAVAEGLETENSRE